MLTDNLLRPMRIPQFYIFHFTFYILSALSEPGKAPKCGQHPYIPNEPNFKTPRLTVTLDMMRTYNDSQPKKRKKNEPKTHQKRTKIEKNRIKTNENEQNSTTKTTPQTQFIMR